jgi:outer membrane protein TolC
VQQYISPLYRHWSPLNATVQIAYQFSPINSDASGRFREASAALDAQRIARGVVERSITTGVVVTLANVRRSIASAQASETATAAARQTVENELHKFRLGSSTVIDVTLSEDGLTNALLAEVAARQSYANAIARLQYELGTLVSGDRQAFTGNVSSLLRAPSIIATP